jgi:protein phosphatase
METLVQAAALRPRVEIASHTDPGRDPDKQTNEDAHAYKPTPFGHLLVVCDGMGGHHAGEEASNTALRTIVELLESANLQVPVRGALEHAIRTANDRVYALAPADQAARPGSTIVLAMVQASGAVVAHVGDSRCYLVRQGQAIALTKDHSVVQQMVDAGMLTPEQAVGHPDANRILRALGVAPAVEVDVRADTVPFAAGDTFILCSDGLTDLVNASDIARVVNESATPEEASSRLVDLANERGGHDNITVLAARVLDDATMQAAPTIVNTVPEARPTPGAFAPTAASGPGYTVAHHTPPGAFHPGMPVPMHGMQAGVQPGMQGASGQMPAPMVPQAPPSAPSSGRLPPAPYSNPSLPNSRPMTGSGNVERSILIVGVTLFILLLAVVAAITGILLARPRSKTPSFVDAGAPNGITPPASVVLPADGTPPAPDVAPTEVPSLVPSPSAPRTHHRKPSQ